MTKSSACDDLHCWMSGVLGEVQSSLLSDCQFLLVLPYKCELLAVWMDMYQDFVRAVCILWQVQISSAGW